MLFVLVKPTWMLILKPRAGVSLDHLHIGLRQAIG
jgi:hypothetical protein